MPAASRPGSAGHRAPGGLRTSSRPSSSATRPGQQAGRQAHVERAVDVGPAQRRQEAGPRASRAGWPTAAAATSAPDSASDARPRTTVNSPVRQHARSPGPRAGGSAPAGGTTVAERARRAPRPPRRGGSARDVAASSVEAGGRGRQLDDLDPVARRPRGAAAGTGPAAPPSGRGRAGATVPPGGAGVVDGGPRAGRARPRPAGRRRAGRRRCRCR